MQYWRILSHGRLQMELCLNESLINKWKNIAKKGKDAGINWKGHFLRNLIEEFLVVLNSEVFYHKMDDESDLAVDISDAVNDACVLYCERFMEFLIDLLSQLPTRRNTLKLALCKLKT